jgi:hypothetical protein
MDKQPVTTLPHTLPLLHVGPYSLLIWASTLLTESTEEFKLLIIKDGLLVEGPEEEEKGKGEAGDGWMWQHH